MADRVYNALFICTGNSARSILAEALLNHAGKGRFKAYSAGSFPAGVVNPHALHALRDLGIVALEARSKSWDEFATADSPRMDFVFTVCDNAAGEVCPVWPGQPVTAHWGVPDPAAVQGSEAEVQRAFRDVALAMQRRVELLLALPLSTLGSAAIQRNLRAIGAR